MTLYSAYKKQLSISSNIDLQTIYDADVDSGDAVITTNTTDGSVVIAGSASLSVTATNGVSITNALTLSNKTSGSVLFAGAAGLVQQDNANLFWDDTNNLLGIGNSAPVALFSVGSTSQFRVDSSGNILRINDVVTSFPASQGAASTFLQNNGSGVLTWVSASPTAVVTLSAAQLAAQTSVEIVLSPSLGQYLLPTEVEALFTYGTALGAGDVTLKYSNQTLSTLTNLLSNIVTKQVAQNVHSLTPENSALYVKAALGFLTAAFGGNNSNFTSIAIDSANVPYVAFKDGGNTKPTVYKFDGVAWNQVGAAFGGSFSNYTSIAIDSAGAPYVAFSDGGNGGKPTVYKFDGVAWTLVGLAFGGNTSNYTSIAIDSADVPYVAFNDGGNGGKPTVAALTAPAGATVKLRVHYQVLSLLT